jgi:hypothetical protein
MSVKVICVGCAYETSVSEDDFSSFGRDAETGMPRGTCPQCHMQVLQELTPTTKKWATLTYKSKAKK